MQKLKSCDICCVEMENRIKQREGIFLTWTTWTKSDYIRLKTYGGRKVVASVMTIATVSRKFCQWRIWYENASLN